MTLESWQAGWLALLAAFDVALFVYARQLGRRQWGTRLEALGRATRGRRG